MQKKISLITVILSIICLILNLVYTVINIINGTPYWKHLIAIVLMLAIGYTSYKSYKRQK